MHKLINPKRLKKAFSTGLAVVTFLTNCVLAHAAETNFWKERQKSLPQPPPQLAMNLPVPVSPLQFGSVRGVSKLPDLKKTSRLVIHIQDVHRNFEAQSNIGNIVASLMSQGNIGLVALEGS